MTAIDSDVLTLFFQGYEPYVIKLRSIPSSEVALPVVVVEEATRGRLDAIRKAQQGGDSDRLIDSYAAFGKSCRDLARFGVLPYTSAAHDLFLTWRAAKIRIGTRDIRIAAIAVAHDIELATNNRRDFEKVPGLKLSVWN